MDAIAYIRWSTQDQSRGDSEQRQQQLAKVTCEQRKWTLTEIVIENGKSAYHGRHRADGGKFAEIEKRAALGELRGMALLVEQLDRLSRQEPLEGLNLLSSLTKAGMTVVETTSGSTWTEESVKENWTTLLTAFIRAGLAFDESFKKAGRIRSAWRTTQTAGLTRAGKPDPRISPNWIEVVDGEWRVIEGRAAVIRQAYEWSAQGLGSRQIAMRLNDIPTGRWAKGSWRPANINFIIKGRQALGEYLPQSFGDDGIRRPCGDWIKLYPSIIDEDLWSRANDALGRRQNTRTGGPRRKMTNLLSGLAFCGVCDGKLTQRSLDKVGKRRLVCSSFHRGSGCKSNMTYRYEDLLDHVLDLMLAVSLPEPSVGDDVVHEVETLARSIGQKRERLTKLVDAFSRTGSAAMERGIITLESDIESEVGRVREL